MSTNTQEHLVPALSARGLKYMAPVADVAGMAIIEVHESTAARAPHVWIEVRSEAVHLPVEAARRFAEQVLWLCDHHYQVEGA